MQVVARVVHNMVAESEMRLTSLKISQNTPLIFNSFSNLCFPASATLPVATSLYYRRNDPGQRFLLMSRDLPSKDIKN